MCVNSAQYRQFPWVCADGRNQVDYNDATESPTLSKPYDLADGWVIVSLSSNGRVQHHKQNCFVWRVDLIPPIADKFVPFGAIFREVSAFLHSSMPFRESRI